MFEGNSEKYYSNTWVWKYYYIYKKKYDDYTMFRASIFFIFVVIKFQHSLSVPFLSSRVIYYLLFILRLSKLTPSPFGIHKRKGTRDDAFEKLASSSPFTRENIFSRVGKTSPQPEVFVSFTIQIWLWNFSRGEYCNKWESNIKIYEPTDKAV